MNKLFKQVIDFLTCLLFKTPKEEPLPVNTEKENEKPIEYVETENTIQKVDSKSISDEEVQYLMQAGCEKTLEMLSGKCSPINLNNEERQFF